MILVLPSNLIFCDSMTHRLPGAMSQGDLALLPPKRAGVAAMVSEELWLKEKPISSGHPTSNVHGTSSLSSPQLPATHIGRGLFDGGVEKR